MTKKMMTILFMAAMTMVTMTTACSGDDPLSSSGNGNDDNNGSWNDNSSSSSASATTTSAYQEMTSFSIALDKTTAEPTSAAEAQYPDGISAYKAENFSTTVNIDMANPVDPAVSGVTVAINGNHVTVDHGSTTGVCYVVTGTTTDGSLTINGSADCAVNLNNAQITNSASTALDIESKGTTYLVATGSNKLTDGAAEDHKGAVFAKGALLISGDGSLEVYGTYKNGIHGKSNVVIDKGVNLYVNSTKNNGIKAGGDVFINGGIINVEVSAEGGKAINGDYSITINGGRTTVIATGNGTWEVDETLKYGGDTKAAAGIGCDENFYMNGGELYAKATGSGGKGIKADYEGYITGGKIRIITEGGLYYSNGTTESHNYNGNTDNLPSAYTSSPKGIKIGTKDEDDNVIGNPVLKISGGDIMVRTSGNNAEGIESKGTFDVTGGTVLVYAHDDALNSTGDMTFTGGTVVAVGTNNDAVDANGNMYIKGGTIIACGASGAEAGIDINEQKKLYITGGYLFAIGGRVDGNLGSTSQGIITTTGSITANGTVSISNSSKTLYTFNMPPVPYNSGTMIITTPDLTNGSSYTLTSGNKTATVTASNSINSSMGGGQPGGGGMPGGGGGQPGGGF